MRPMRPMRTRNNLSTTINLINLFRELWVEHVLWTRLFIISTVSDLDDIEYVTHRLLRNPTDFANVLKLYYGEKIAKEFERLFTAHLTIAGDLVKHAKAGDTEAANQDRTNWYKNADEIISFLSCINPYWNMREFQSLFYHHLEMTENEAVYRLTKKYPQDIINYDMIQSEALKMADIMSNGILDQFYGR